MKNAIISIVVVIIIAGGLWFFLGRQDEPPPEPSNLPLPDIRQEGQAAQPDPNQGVDLPDDTDALPQPEPPRETIEGPPADAAVDEVDAFIFKRFSNDNPLLVELLSRENLIRKLVIGTDLMVRELNPYRPFNFMTLQGELITEERAGRIYLSPENFKRYDPYLAALAKVTDDDVGQIYGLLLPFIKSAYGELGHVDRDWSTTLDAAYDVLLSFEPPPNAESLELVGKDGTFIYADPKLEQLSPTHKALLRMGPDNAAKLQNMVRRFRNQVNAP